jgi:hypothetical protein
MYLIMPLCYLQRTHTVAETEARNLRPRPPKNFVENANEEIDEGPDYEDLDYEPMEIFYVPTKVLFLVFCYIFQQNHILSFRLFLMFKVFCYRCSD